MKNNNKLLLERNNNASIQWEQPLGEALDFIYKEEGEQFFQNAQGKILRIVSCVDEASLKNIDACLTQIVFFFGLATLGELEEAQRRANPDSLFVIIEPNTSLFHHAIEHDDFQKVNVDKHIFLVDTPEKVSELLKELTYTKALLFLRRPVFYFNSYYREHELSLIKEYVSAIREAIQAKFFRIGNSIHDSLLGLVHNMQNIPALCGAIDVNLLKGKMDNIPAFVVAAGPSLDKNIEELKKIEDKGIIIAVDTIAEKLVKNGIKPHFIASVERINVWEYFYENKLPYYEGAFLVAPPVIQSEVVEAFGGNVIFPMRNSVREYLWLGDMLGLAGDGHKIWMGASCSHVAAGLAIHLGASPIVLVGQDLAYGNGDLLKTHARDTEYDEKPEETPEEIFEVEGYHGDVVKTQDLWNQFRKLYEEKIKEDGLTVINATEGGAKIQGTIQMRLSEVVGKYCTTEIHMNEFLSRAPRNRLDLKIISAKMKAYCEKLEQISSESLTHLNKLKSILLKWDYYYKQRGAKYIFNTMQKTDAFYKMIPGDELLYHNIQGPMVILMQKFHLISEDGSEKSLKDNLLVQIEFCEMFSNTTWLIAQVIEENFPWITGDDKNVK